jgi:hypothetical protein
MPAGASYSTPLRVPDDLPGSSRAGRYFRILGNILMDSPELVAVPCPECGCSPVEVLMTMHSGRRFLWCPQCRAIWAVDTWVLNRPASITEQPPKVIAFGPLSGRRPF